MIIRCKVCQCPFETRSAGRNPLPGEEQQVAELLRQMGAHLRTAHPLVAQDMTFTLAVISTHLLFEHIDIPEGETLLREQREHGRAAVEQMLQTGRAGVFPNPRAGEIH